MKLLMVCLMGLILCQANMAQQSTVSGQVRLADGRPVAGAQVTLFDLADSHQGAVARAMTDESGYFALPLASLGGAALPQGFALGHNYPNPFNPSTVIPYQLPAATEVRLDVFNVLGQHVATLVDAEQQAGFHTAKWDATDAAGQAMAAGVYFYRLTTSGGQQTQRMVLVDGQAGIAATSSTAATMSTDAVGREYGLVVSGEGLTTYTDAAFEVRAGMAAVELVVEAEPLTMVSGKPALKYSDTHPSWSPDGRRIAFASNRAGSFDIYVMDSDGQNLDSLNVRKEATDNHPSWSPDGRRIAFASNRAGSFDIYVMDSDGKNLEPLAPHKAMDNHPSWSPDGQIAFASNRAGNFDIYVMDSDRNNLDRLTDHEARDNYPSWSPDGRYIAFVSERDDKSRGVYVIDLLDENKPPKPQRLTDHKAAPSPPSWLPDGRIVFATTSGPNSAIYAMDLDGGNLQDLTTGASYPSLSSDGQQIAFVVREANYSAIRVMDVDGSDIIDIGNAGTDDGEVVDDGTETDDQVSVSRLPGGAQMEFVWIERGVFQMGSDTGRRDESPVHEVEISRGFWLGKYEVTQEQWKSVMGEEPWSGRSLVKADSSHPAVIISWNEVQEFIGRLNAAADEELYRLPTEAEWEYACRAGTDTRWSFGDDESLLADYAWYHDNNSPTGAKAVGKKSPNPWGLYDMHGNVWEWVQDWYDEEYYSRSVRNDPQGPTSGLNRVIRGGHFGHIDGVRSAYRHLRSPDSRSYTIGVRLLKIAKD